MPKGPIKLFPVNKDVFMTLLDDYGLSIRKLGDSNIVSCTEKKQFVESLMPVV